MGMRLQKFLRAGKTIETLKRDYSIDSYKHPDFPLIGFKCPAGKFKERMQIEANGCIFQSDNWNLIAKGIDRIQDITTLAEFDWSNYDCSVKKNGATVLLFNHLGEWLASINDSFEARNPEGYNGTWQDLFWECAGNMRGKLCHVGRYNSYTFKLCTPFNSLRKYSEPRLFLLGANHVTTRTATTIDYDRRNLKAESVKLGIPLATPLMLYSRAEIDNFLKEKEEADPTFNGVIIRDCNNKRYKIETKSYKIFSQLYDNGNIVKAKNLTSAVLSNKQDKVLKAWPDLKPALTEVSEVLDKAFADLANTWLLNKDVKTRKEFAAKINGNPFSFILFSMLGKHGAKGTVDQLKSLWVKDHLHEKIAKRFLGDRTFEFANTTAVI